MRPPRLAEALLSRLLPRHDRSDGLWRAQRKLLGHKFANHQAGIGRQHDHTAIAKGLRRIGRKAHGGEPSAGWFAQPRTRQGTGKNAD